MKLFLKTSADIEPIDVTDYTTEVTVSGDYQKCLRTATFGIISNASDKNIDVINCDLGTGVVIKEGDKVVFNGFIYTRTKATNDSVIDITAFDRGIFLKRNEAVYDMNMTPEAMVKRMCYNFGMTVGNVAATGITIKRKFVGTNLADIIKTLYTKAAEVNGKSYVIRFEDNKLCVVERTETVVLEIDGEANLMSAATTESAEGLVDCVTIYDKNGNWMSTLKDDELIQRFGLLQRYLKQSDGDVNAEAKKILADNGVTQKITVDNIGNVDCISGNAVTVKEPYTGLTGLFYIDGDTHTWRKGQYYNKLTLNFKKIMSESNSGSES